jgi:hypothetical protein
MQARLQRAFELNGDPFVSMYSIYATTTPTTDILVRYFIVQNVNGFDLQVTEIEERERPTTILPSHLYTDRDGQETGKQR